MSPGLAPKTAKELLYKFGTLDGVYQHLEDPSIRPKLREKLETGKESAYLSYDLATIIPEAPIVFSPEDALKKEYNKPELYALFQKLEFVRLIDKYGLRGTELSPAAAETVVSLQTLPKVETLPETLKKCAFYLAPDGTLAFAWADGLCQLTPMEAQMVALPHCEAMILHDARATLHHLENLGIHWNQVEFDTALAAYDLNPSQSDYPVSKLATNFLGITVEDSDAAACAQAMWNLEAVLRQELETVQETELYNTIELPLCEVLYKMERRGIAIDETQLRAFGKMLSGRIADCEALIFGFSGGPFNINSPKQLGELLFDKLGLPAGKKTKTGYSTNADVLEKLKDKHPIIPAIMDYRDADQAEIHLCRRPHEGSKGGRSDPHHLPESCHRHRTAQLYRAEPAEYPHTNRPGRRDPENVRAPSPAASLWTRTTSQIELRVLSLHCRRPGLCRTAFCSGHDIHAATASQVFGVPH